jgi:hypothetical protein
MTTTDRDARKQLLLTRIAFERSLLRRDMGRVRQAASVPHMLRAALPGGVGQALFGADRLPANTAGWLALGLGLLRRYRTAAALVGGLAPALGLRRSLRSARRLGIVALVGTGAWYAWQVFKRP